MSNCGLCSSLLQLSLASILFSIFLLCLCIVRKPAVFDFISCLGFCEEIIVAYRRRTEPFHSSFENVLKLTKDAKQLADITSFPLENVNKHGFFEILSPQSILLVPSFPRMKSGNRGIFAVRNRMIGIISLLVLYDLKIWCNCYIFTVALHITG